jgi:heat shock protein HslJ
MVNSRSGTGLQAAFLAGLMLFAAGPAPAQGSFPLERKLESTEGPLPGCTQTPILTVSQRSGRVHFRICCNQISAPGSIEGGFLMLTGPAIATRMHCGDGQAAEDRFLRQIDSQRRIGWRQDGALIVLETDPPLRYRSPPQ